MIQCKDLDEVRNNIDRIDRKIVELIAERSSFVRQAAAFKKDTGAVKAPTRVEAVIEKVRMLADEFQVDAGVVESVYRTMIDCFVRLELEEFQKSAGN